MKFIKRYIPIYFSLVILALFLLSCASDGNGPETPTNTNSQTQNEECAFKVEYPEPNDVVTGEINAGGSHNCPISAHIWIVLSDGYGYYLQSPEVTLYEETWEHNNIHLGGGIKSIIVVWVDENGHNEFLKKVKNKEWGQFSQLPYGSKKIAAVPIKN